MVPTRAFHCRTDVLESSLIHPFTMYISLASSNEVENGRDLLRQEHALLRNVTIAHLSRIFSRTNDIAHFMQCFSGRRVFNTAVNY